MGSLINIIYIINIYLYLCLPYLYRYGNLELMGLALMVGF